MSLSLTVFLCGCSSFSHTNVALKDQDAPTATKASILIQKDRGKKEKILFILSLSGGGSRAAYFSAATMLALEKVFEHDNLNLLEEVDIISSVSGGSLPAAYYAISVDAADDEAGYFSTRKWDEHTVKELMSKNYKLRWIGNWFWPTNIAKYWFTAFDRTDIMAQTLADNMFDRKVNGKNILSNDLKFKDIKQDRPNIVINATDGTNKTGSVFESNDIPTPFTFTDEDFKTWVNSDIEEYDISRAVMASASFPAAFNSMTLKNFNKDTVDQYFHVFDGGNIDNLGLASVKRIINKNIAQSPENYYSKIIVVLVDSYTENMGISSSRYDGRDMLSYIADLNFIDSFNSLLSINRLRVIKDFNDYMKSFHGDTYDYVFYHLDFSEIQDENLRKKVNSIPTDFSINSASAKAIDKAVEMIITPENKCLKKIRNLILNQGTPHSNGQCN